MAAKTERVTLRPETLLAFDSYIENAETQMEETLHASESFLWSVRDPDRIRRRQQGEVLAQLWSGDKPVEVPSGLIHDWIGAISVPEATVDKTLTLIQNYDNHKNIYKPDVIDSKLIRRCGDDYTIYLRLLKKKIITVVLDTEHKARYSRPDATYGYCNSRTTRIAEVQNAGRSDEKLLPPDTGFGFLWRLFSYWRFMENAEGTVIECRAISLTRDIPTALKWVIQPIVRSLPKESLINTLSATRKALTLSAETKSIPVK
jgi:hypothetical protein